MKKTILVLMTIVVCLISGAQAAVVGPAGYTADFSTLPVPADWATRSITGGANGAADSTNVTQVGTNVAAIAASSITTAVNNSSPTNPPAAALASWTSAGTAFLATRPTGVRLTLLMATLVNNTGSNVDTVNISYNLTIVSNVTEEVTGHLVYYSFTGAAGSWVSLVAAAASGPVTASINTPWLAGTSLYVLLADDNGTGTPDTLCEIDDFVVTTSGGSMATTAITITSPTNTQSIVEGANFAVTTLASGTITGTGFYLDGALVGSDATLPYSVTYSNVALGPHTLTVVANNSVTSSPVQITIVANNPPGVALVSNPAGTMLVGSNIVNTATVTDTDPGGSVQRVEFYLDGVLKVTDITSPYTYELCDILAGSHTVMAVAVDQAGARGTNTSSLTATNPADTTIIIANGSTWQYLDKGTDPRLAVPAWPGPLFDASSWSNGVAELGYGDASNNNRPETTVVGFGPNANAKFATTYFRKQFNLGDPTAITNLIVRTLRDDGAIVYLNGVEVFRTAITNTVVANGTYTPPAVGDDGTFYQVTNISPPYAFLNVGANVVDVELHQDAVGSSDISFDLMLWSQGPTGPRPSIVLNLDGSVTITWPSGALICTSDPGVPRASWTPVAATSPYTIPPGSQAAHQFYALLLPLP